MFVTPIAVGLMFRFLLNQQLGPIPEILGKAGITIDFFGPSLALPTIIAIDVWQWTPFMVLLLLAGLESLPRQPFEAARVDGASWWLTFRKVTLPLLRPVIGIAILLRALDAFKIFEYVFATTRGGPGNATDTLQYLIYRTGFGFFRLGEAAAMGFVLVGVVLLLVAVLYRMIMRQEAAS
jgi:multiple sugar transport system permease protein